MNNLAYFVTLLCLEYELKFTCENVNKDVRNDELELEINWRNIVKEKPKKNHFALT